MPIASPKTPRDAPEQANRQTTKLMLMHRWLTTIKLLLEPKLTRGAATGNWFTYSLRHAIRVLDHAPHAVVHPPIELFLVHVHPPWPPPPCQASFSRSLPPPSLCVWQLARPPWERAGDEGQVAHRQWPVRRWATGTATRRRRQVLSCRLWWPRPAPGSLWSRVCTYVQYRES
jgi:hypothetical protein